MLPAMMAILKSIAYLFILTLLSCTQLQHDRNNEIKNPTAEGTQLTNVKFDKVVAYDFAGDTNIPLLDSNNKITNTVTKKLVLSGDQFEELKSLLADTSTFGGEQPVDFYPHFGIVFYKNDKIVHSFEISLPCNSILGTVSIPGLNGREYPNAGFSEKGREQIYQFCKKNGFEQYLDKDRWCCIEPAK